MSVTFITSAIANTASAFANFVTSPMKSAPVTSTRASASAITTSNMRDHVREKAMWAGALTRINIPNLLGATDDGSIITIDRQHTPALLKIFDEIIVNGTDHTISHLKCALSQRVTKIEITFDPETGRFSVFNDGPGIPVILHAEETQKAGHNVYVPEIAFSQFLAGTNINKELDNVKGGINGLGAKIANAHSIEFTIETIDGVNRRSYRQQWRDGLSKRFDPVIRECDRSTPTYTVVSFIPTYDELQYTTPLNKNDINDIDAYLRLRAHQAAAYVGETVSLFYNHKKCETTSVATLGKLLLPADDSQSIILQTQVKSTEEPYKQHPWNIAVIILPAGKKVPKKSAIQNMTIINGVISNKGSHIQYIRKILSTAVENKLHSITKANKITMNDTLAGVRIVMCGAIPGVDWGGQRKDEIQVSKETLEHYTFTATSLKQFSEVAAEKILLAQNASSARAGKVVHKKFTKARYAGKSSHKRNTYLLAAEGDSAITLLRAGLTQTRKTLPPGGPSLDWCGIISLQGVIINAAREVTEMETSGGDIINVRSAKLQTNKRLIALADAFGLAYGRSYTTPEELSTLNYGKLVLCVDQDLDGIGKIAALVLVWIYLFWPALIAAGYIGRLITPIVRAYPRRGARNPVEFYYEEELKTWLKEDPSRPENYNIKCYKGLATHDSDEVKRMFKPDEFKHNIHTYKGDRDMERLFKVYFGDDPSLRKDILVTPVKYLSLQESINLQRLQHIPVSRVQLDIDTKSYKNDAIKRQIPGITDGLNPVRSKILMGSIKEASSKELKIYQLGGAVAYGFKYHHGDASLNASIIHMAQSYPGARKYPYLIGIGQFGSRHGDKAGSARYISVKLSPIVKTIFPPADRWHLPYVFEDGERAEPQYFVPVIPMAVLESYKIVSEGWNHISFGRDFNDVIAVVEAYINGNPDLTNIAERLHNEGLNDSVMTEIHRLSNRWPLRPSTRDYKGEIRPYRNGDNYSFGSYIYDEPSRIVRITELPIGISTAKYLETLMKPGRSGKVNSRSEFIETINDRSSGDTVELEIRLNVGAFEKILENIGNAFIDPIEDALMLRSSMRSQLNYYSTNGAVLEFSGYYLANILYWAPLRRNLYVTRLIRSRTVTELRILENKEIIRYIGLAAELNLAKIENDEFASELFGVETFPHSIRA
ncbi:uncharacterized protein LOC136088444 [Hydra vulgaris]|uniref:DNA topoisomerase (ATP-hydrolyzing) n=1 Tax=Hydra vulgaris TaxID=6087 RepID=A0ABM4D1W1_HYDVU